MKKEKSKILLGIIGAIASLFIVLFSIFQFIASNYREQLDYNTMQFFMRGEVAHTEMIMTELAIIKDMIRTSSINSSYVQENPQVKENAKDYFKHVCTPTNEIVLFQQRIKKAKEGMRRFSKDFDSLEAKSRLFDCLSKITLTIALWASLAAIWLGLNIHDLYKS